MVSIPVIVSAHAAVLSLHLRPGQDLDRVAIIVEHHLGEECEGEAVLSSDHLEQVVLENLVQYRCFVLTEEEEAIVLQNKLLIIDFHLNYNHKFQNVTFLEKRTDLKKQTVV